MKEDILLCLMRKDSVVAWNLKECDDSLTIHEFMVLARINNYQTAAFTDGWLIAYQPSHNLESARSYLGESFLDKTLQQE